MESSDPATPQKFGTCTGVLIKFFTFSAGRLLERGAYFEILKNRNSDFSYVF